VNGAINTGGHGDARRRQLVDLLAREHLGKGQSRLETLLEATHGAGEDVAFLDRWGYDAAQRAAIAEAVLAVAEG
jgi:hypothetical protein